MPHKTLIIGAPVGPLQYLHTPRPPRIEKPASLMWFVNRSMIRLVSSKLKNAKVFKRVRPILSFGLHERFIVEVVSSIKRENSETRTSHL